MADTNSSLPAVRFTDVNEEMSPPDDPESNESEADVYPRQRDDLSPEAQEQLKNLKLTMRKSRLQASRMENFSFEPMSLPASRAPSPARGSRNASQRASPSATPSGVPSPPITPFPTQSREAKRSVGGASSSLANEQIAPDTITPQLSGPHNAPPLSSTASSRLDSVSDQTSTRNTSVSDSPVQKKIPRLSDAYGIDPKSIFINPKDQKAQNTLQLPSAQAQAQSATAAHRGSKVAESRIHDEKRSSIFGSKKHLGEEDSHSKHHLGSMSDLKRFFKLGGSHKHKDKHDESRHGSTASQSRINSRSERSGSQTPPHQAHQAAVPFADDHGLENKYGKFGKVLGSGAGGSVRLMKRSSDGTTFAVKQFRARHSYETEKEYNKKVTSEFCIGSTLHHGNVIETMDIVHEKGSWFEVMEYAPYDLFAIVMSGKMTREEVTCCTVQVINGVSYLHSMGLAHRDLKLDNVVVNYAGILKLIDFGSAVVFRYPFEDDIVLARGIVGSDPYLAPEVYDERYDPRAVDIWSVAIMYCCMTLRRFPWKAPRTSDNSFKLFASPATPGQPTVESLRRAADGQSLSEPNTRGGSVTSESHHHHHHHHRSTAEGAQSDAATHSNGAEEKLAPASNEGSQTQSVSQTIKGPWRLLRLLPRESRLIIGRMLEIDPKRRATLEEVHNDKWIAASPVCRQEEGGNIIRAKGHDHILEPGGTLAAD